MSVLSTPVRRRSSKRSDFSWLVKTVVAVLVVLLLVLQYRLWFGDGSVQEVWRLTEESRATRTELLRLRGRNQALAAEVRDLKSGLDAIEERARSDLGMIGEDETFYRFVREKGAEVNALEGSPEGEQASAGDAIAEAPGGEQGDAVRDALGDPSGIPAGEIPVEDPVANE